MGGTVLANLLLILDPVKHNEQPTRYSYDQGKVLREPDILCMKVIPNLC